MIKSVRIVNFKSLADVTLFLGHFNCLVGMNGAGKSTVLQALDFLSQLARGDIEGWLEQRGWSAADLRCKLRKESNITFTVYFQVTTGETITWNASFNRTDLRCSRETVYLGAGEGSGFLLRSSEQAF